MCLHTLDGIHDPHKGVETAEWCYCCLFWGAPGLPLFSALDASTVALFHLSSTNTTSNIKTNSNTTGPKFDKYCILQRAWKMHVFEQNQLKNGRSLQIACKMQMYKYVVLVNVHFAYCLQYFLLVKAWSRFYLYMSILICICIRAFPIPFATFSEDNILGLYTSISHPSCSILYL